MSYNIPMEQNNNRLNLSLIWNGALVGLLTAASVQLFKVLSDSAAVLRNTYITEYGGNWLFRLACFFVLAVLAIFVGQTVKREKSVAGSGVAQAKLYVKNPDVPAHRRKFFYKYLGSVIVLSSGLTAGRVGPSVHFGTMMGIEVGKQRKMGNKHTGLLVMGGIASGICALFNAPLAGIIFVLEIITDDADENVLTAMLSSVASSYFFINLFSNDPAFALRDIPNLPLQYYHLGLVLILFSILFSKLFNLLLLKTFLIMKKVPIKDEYLPLIPFLITGFLYFTDLNFVGFEHELLMNLRDSGIVSSIALYFAIKLLLTMITYGSRVPGGLVYPVIFLGSVAGLLIYRIGGAYFGVSELYMMNFVALGIAAFLTGVYKAPLTATVLMTELTGGFVHLLPVILTVLFVQMGTDFLDIEPVHEILVRYKSSEDASAKELTFQSFYTVVSKFFK